MRVAYADPPYVGQSRKHYGGAEVNHRLLIAHLCDEFPDGWSKNPVIVPRFVESAVKSGLRLADSIGIEKADDGTWLTITFKKFPKPLPAPPAGTGGQP